MTALAASRRVAASRRGHGHRAAPVTWEIAEEAPVALAYNGRQRAVMMATPADLEDFAVGFALTEGVVAALEEIEDVVIETGAQGIVADVTVDPALLARARLRRRAMEGRTSCGICGVAALDDLARPLRPPLRRPPVAAVAMARGFAELDRHQPLNARCRSVHAAAWCARDGAVLLAREDVGRHNALDKLIGALALAGTDPGTGFVVMSSRCSFELVQKAAAGGIDTLATVSAPTGFALDLAAEAGMRLGALAGDGVVVFDDGKVEVAA